MNKVILVMFNEIGRTLRRKSFTIMALGLPVALGIVALVVMAVNRDAASVQADARGPVEETEEVAEGYVDKAGLVEVLPADIRSDWLIEYPDEAAAQTALEAGEISDYYVISPDYVETGDVTLVRLQYNPISDDVTTDAIEWILLVNLLGDEELAADVWNPLVVEPTPLAPTESETEDSWIVELFPNLMAFILYLVILLPAGVLVNAVTDEKKNRVMEVLMSSVSSHQLIGGKILALGLLGLLQTGLWIGILWMVVRFGGQPLNIPAGFVVPNQLLVWAFVYGLLGYAIYGAQMAGLGALAPDVKDSRGPSFVIMLPLIFVYMFLIGILARPDGPLALVLSLFPLTSPVGMIARMTKTTVPTWQAVLAAVLQLLTAILIVRLVARLFRAQHLLSGQPFSLQRYFRALLGRA